MAISESAADTELAAFEKAQGRIAFDSNLRLRLGRAAAMADYFFPSIEDARELSGIESPEENLAWAHDLGAKTVFLKLGPEGALVSDGKKRERLHGKRVKALDATGAGDCFCGAAAAALATTGFGAVDPLPRPDAVRAML